MSKTSSTGIVIHKPGHIELAEFDIPPVRDNSALLDIEVCGICGADVELYRGHSTKEFEPCVLGHEPVGRIREIGSELAARWKVSAGDRVVVNEVIACGNCALCAAGRGELCNGFFGTAGSRYGFIPTTKGSGLWGGFSTTMELDARTQLRPIAEHVPTSVAAMFMPISNGVHWLFELARLRPRDSVLIIGPGVQGLAVAAVGARAADLDVIVAGIASDRHRLKLAKEVGALAAVDTSSEDVVDVVMSATEGIGVDAVVIVTSGTDSVISTATRCARTGGTIVVAGTNGWKSEQRFKADALVFRDLTLRGAPGHSIGSVERAVKLLESAPEAFEPLVGAEYALRDVASALDISTGAATAGGVHMSVRPDL